MNEEMLKTVLLEIIKETDNLPESELEIVPGTRFRVKKGRVDEFKANARFYYQLTKNQEINSDQYLREVYYELSDELARDQVEYVFSKAYDLYDLGKEETDRLAKLNEALAKNKKQLEEYKSREESLKKDSQTNTNLWVEANKVQTERQELENTITYLNNLILKTTVELKDKVNNEVKKITAQEMEYLRNQITTVNKGVTTSWGIDGHNILKSDEEYYNNLWYLSNILNNVKDNLPLINVGNAIWVNHEQLASAQELVSKIDYLRLVKKEDAQALNQKPNDKLIAEISKELDYLRAENTSTSKLEYDHLKKILEYLNAAKENEFALTPVWDIAYVNGPDRNAFIELLRESSFFQKYNPDLKLREKNEKLILELRKYISELEENYNQKARESLTNVPGINYQNHIILESDKKELENVLAVISILENAKNDLIELSIGGCVPANIIPGYKKLISEIKYFTPKVEEKSLSSENKKLIEEIEKRMDGLLENNAFSSDKKEEYDLLKQQLDILQASTAEETKEIEGATIRVSDEVAYQAILEKIKKLTKPNIDPLKANKELAEKLKLMLDNLTPEDKKKADLLARMCEILTTVDLTKKVINLSDNFDGIILNEEEAKEFQQISQELNTLDRDSNSEKTIDLTKKNQEEIIKIKNEMAQLLVFGKVMPEYQKEYEFLENLLNILSMTIPVDELKEINGVTISSKKEEEYLKILFDLENLRKPVPKEEEKFELEIMEEKKKILKWSEENKDILENSEETIKLLQEQISMLESASKKEDSLYLSKEDSTLFYEIDKKLPFLSGIISNESLVEQLERKISKADSKINPKEYGFLVAQLEVLKKFKYLNYQTVMKVDGAYIPLEYVRGYMEILKNIEKARKESPKRINEAIILETENKMKSLLVDGKIPTEHQEEYDLLDAKLTILEQAEKVNELEEVQGAKVPKASKERYLEILEELKKIEEKKRGTSPNPNPPKPSKLDKVKRKLVTAIRKSKKLEWWKKHKNVIAAIGLTILLVASLSTLIPTILYANACLSSAIPALAPGINALNVSIINSLGIPLGSLNFNASAINLGGALLNSLLKLGIIGGGAIGLKEIYKQYKREHSTRLPDPNEKDLENKVKQLGANIISQVKNLGKSLSNKASEFVQNTAKALDGKNIDFNHDLLEKRIQVEPFITTETNNKEQEKEEPKKEDSIPIFTGKVLGEGTSLSPEEEKEIREKMAQAIDVTYKPVTIPNNEELVEALEENFGRGR